MEFMALCKSMDINFKTSGLKYALASKNKSERLFLNFSWGFVNTYVPEMICGIRKRAHKNKNRLGFWLGNYDVKVLEEKPTFLNLDKGLKTR